MEVVATSNDKAEVVAEVRRDEHRSDSFIFGFDRFRKGWLRLAYFISGMVFVAGISTIPILVIAMCLGHWDLVVGPAGIICTGVIFGGILAMQLIGLHLDILKTRELAEATSATVAKLYVQMGQSYQQQSKE